ncbi:MAG: hypothetical protein PHQ86_07785 [Dehalococcoidales bacterium]|nr:hypothetical protein [Dehalococcoidales bacterium]
MDININMVVALILVTVVWAVAFALFFKGLFWVFSNIYSLLYKTARFRTFIAFLQNQVAQPTMQWWRANLPSIIRFFEYFYEVFGDLVIFGYATWALGQRLQDIQQFVVSNPQYKYWQVLDYSMNTDVVFWWVLIILLSLWILGKAKKYAKDRENTRENKQSLSEINSKMETLNITMADMSGKLDKLDTVLDRLSQAIEKSTGKGKR